MLGFQREADVGEVRQSPADEQLHRGSGDGFVVKAYVETSADVGDGVQLGVHDHDAPREPAVALGGFDEPYGLSVVGQEHNGVGGAFLEDRPHARLGVALPDRDDLHRPVRRA